MKKTVILLFLSSMTLFSCRSKELLIRQETSVVDTIIVVPGDTVSNKGKVGRDTVTIDNKTGIRTEVKFLGQDYRITTIVPEKEVDVKFTKTTSKFSTPSIEKSKNRQERKTKRDISKLKIKSTKDSLKYDNKNKKDSLKSDIKKTKIEKKVSFFDKLKIGVTWIMIAGIIIIILLFGNRLKKR